MGRRLPRKSHRSLSFSPDSPELPTKFVATSVVLTPPPLTSPARRQVHCIAQENKAAIAGPHCVALRAHAMMEGNHVTLGDFIKMFLSERRQQVVAQVRIVRLPRALVTLHEWHIALVRELGEGRHGAQGGTLLGWVFPEGDAAMQMRYCLCRPWGSRYRK
jgi:hypothetical protein